MRRCWGGKADASSRAALARGLRVVDASCWYLDWPSPWRNYHTKRLLSGWTVEDRILGGEAAIWTEDTDASNLERERTVSTAVLKVV